MTSRCLDIVADGMKQILGETASVGLLVENTSGQGGNTSAIVSNTWPASWSGWPTPRRSGVCLDTCHIFAAGYDIRDGESYEKTMGRFDAIVGRPNLRAAHLNDAKVELGSRKDRHDSIGRGKLGLEAFRLLMNDPRFDDLPLILETIDDTIWEAEIELLYSLVEPIPAF